MSKYPEYRYEMSDETLQQESGEYKVYKAPHGRSYLVKRGVRLAERIASGPIDLDKWIRDWEKNAAKQVQKLQQRADELMAERSEIIDLLG